MLSDALGSEIVSGVTTVSEPMAGDVSVQEAPLTPGVLTATTWVVPFVIVAQAASKTASQTTATKRMGPPEQRLMISYSLSKRKRKLQRAPPFRVALDSPLKALIPRMISSIHRRLLGDHAYGYLIWSPFRGLTGTGRNRERPDEAKLT
jgi:hypothetical protein